jgi:hypothetical protein
MQDQSDIDPVQSPRDRIFLDIVQNRCRPKNGRRYSPETLHWAWAAEEQSSTAWDVVDTPAPLNRTRIR